MLDLERFRIRDANSPNEQPITEQEIADDAAAWTLLDLDRFRIRDVNSPSQQSAGHDTVNVQGAGQGTVNEQGAGQGTVSDQGQGSDQERFDDMPPLEYSSSGNDLQLTHLTILTVGQNATDLTATDLTFP